MLFALTLVAAIPSSAQEPPPAEPEGYRLDNYHARTPATLKGATVIDTEQAFEIWTKKEAVFVDTLSRPSSLQSCLKCALATSITTRHSGKRMVPRYAPGRIDTGVLAVFRTRFGARDNER